MGATVGESGGVRDLGWPKKWIRMEDSMIVGDGAEEGEGESIAGGHGGRGFHLREDQAYNEWAGGYAEVGRKPHGEKKKKTRRARRSD